MGGLDTNRRLPPAMRFTTIAVHNINFAQEVVQQVMDNLGEHVAVVLHDPFKGNNPDSKTMVILTNGPLDKPLDVYNRYDAR